MLIEGGEPALEVQYNTDPRAERVHAFSLHGNLSHNAVVF